MLTMTVNQKQILALLELASSFVSDKSDPRLYLQDVFIDKLEDSVNFVGADGHKLIKINIKPMFFDEPLDLPERVSVQSISDAIKVKNYSLIKASNIHPDVKYPDYQRLIPIEYGFIGMPRINVQYIAKSSNAIARCLKKFNCGKYPAIDFVSLSDTNASVFESEICDTVKATLVLMPMRK